MFETTVAEGVLQCYRPETRWLSTAWNGGLERADAAYNVAVPEGWERTDLESYVRDRRERGGFAADGPTLLTGVEMAHARGARLEPVVAYATVGLSNPAALPMDSTGFDSSEGTPPAAGTVNLVVGTTRRLNAATLATLLGTVVEAKTATLIAETGFTGTTTDAVAVGSDETGEPARFAGSATDVGAAARACVREAVRASLRSRYADGDVPAAVEDAEHGAVTGRRAEVFRP